MTPPVGLITIKQDLVFFDLGFHPQQLPMSPTAKWGMAWQASAESEKVKKSAGRPSIGSCGNSPIPHESSNISLRNLYCSIDSLYLSLSLSLCICIYVYVYICIYIYRDGWGSHYGGVFHTRGKGFLWSPMGSPSTLKLPQSIPPVQASKKAEKEELKVWIRWDVQRLMSELAGFSSSVGEYDQNPWILEPAGTGIEAARLVDQRKKLEFIRSRVCLCELCRHWSWNSTWALSWSGRWAIWGRT